MGDANAKILILLHLHACHLLKYKYKAWWIFFLFCFLVVFFKIYYHYYPVKSGLGPLLSKSKPLWYQVKYPAGRQVQHWRFTSEALCIGWSWQHFPWHMDRWECGSEVHNVFSTTQPAATSCPLLRRVRSTGVITTLVARPQNASS